MITPSLIRSPALGVALILGVCLSPTRTVAQPRLAPASLRANRWSALPDARTPIPRVPRRCGLDRGAWWKHPARATGLFATPVAAVSALVADQHRGPAAIGAMAGGAAFAVGATVVWIASPCEKVDGLIYVWTPLAAIAGAFIAAR